MRMRHPSRPVLRWGVLCVGLVLAACARHYPPAPVTYGSGYHRGSGPGRTGGYVPPVAVETGKPVARASTEPMRRWPASGTIAVEPGDTLFRISRRYGVSLDALIALNRLTPPYRLAPGYRLTLPRPKVHAVRAGETIYGVAKQYDVAMAALVRLNGIRPPYRLGIDQQLKIPTLETASLGRVVTASIPAESSRAKMPPRAVTRRDTSRPPVVSRPPPRAAGAFRWPIRGPILIGFGDRGKGLHNDGINIAAKRGRAVRAAENGVVTYAGNELRGFGNLILLRHANGWSSAYAHNAKLLVRAGQRVRRGQVISRIGSTGSVKRPQLHFELRRGDDAVDPAKYLKTRTVRSRRVSRASGRDGRRDPG